MRLINTYERKITNPNGYRISKSFRNRYTNILPFDETERVEILRNFILARAILMPLTKLCLLSSALESTLVDFWQAILHKESRLIVCLSLEEEGGKQKVYPY